MVNDAPYQEKLRALEGELQPTSRRVLPYLFKGSRKGLADAASAADRHADALDGVEPPSYAVAAHHECVAALRAVARDARDLAEKGTPGGGRALLDDLRALPSFNRMVAARKALLAEYSED